jgi:hypothetical protein
MLVVPNGFENVDLATKIIITVVCAAALLVFVVNWRRRK